jgi:hypothetical protein
MQKPEQDCQKNRQHDYEHNTHHSTPFDLIRFFYQFAVADLMPKPAGFLLRRATEYRTEMIWKKVVKACSRT